MQNNWMRAVDAEQLDNVYLFTVSNLDIYARQRWRSYD